MARRKARQPKKERRQAREAYLHFDPGDVTNGSSASADSTAEAEAAAQRRTVGRFAGIIAGLDMPTVMALQHAVRQSSQAPAAAPATSSGRPRKLANREITVDPAQWPLATLRDYSPTFLPTSPE